MTTRSRRPRRSPAYHFTALLAVAFWAAAGCSLITSAELSSKPEGKGHSSNSSGGGGAGGEGQGASGTGASGGGGASCSPACADSELCCDGVCVDFNSPEHCGACDTVCSGSKADCCSGACVDLDSDEANCGNCAMPCPGTLCDSGNCSDQCLLPFEDCDQNIISNGCEANLATDAKNCGTCGLACPENSMCNDGVCMCPPGFIDCDNDPSNGCESDSMTDRGNCGACGMDCGPNRVCTDGVCGCDTGFGDCNNDASDGCEASLNAPATCGDCFTDCGAHSTCSGDPPTCGCETNFLDCNLDTIDGCEAVTTDVANCGDCMTTCSPGDVCDGVQCKADCGAQTQCGTSCIDTSGDPLNCGGCDQVVGPNQDCVGGQPVCKTNRGDCDGDPSDCEADLLHDAQHCNGCGTPCKANAVCNLGTCECGTGTPNDCGASCEECCSSGDCSDADGCTTDTCVNGTCQFAACTQKCCSMTACQECCNDMDCSANMVCSGGQCVPTCMSPNVNCGTDCVNLDTDPKNCGGCGNDCLLGRGCSGGSCTPAWVTIPSTSTPTARSNAAATRTTGSQVFMFGGQSGATNLTDAYVYDASTDLWSQLPSPGLTGRFSSAAVATGTHVIVWGGATGTMTDVNNGARFNLGNGVWDTINTSTGSGVPTARHNPVAFFTGSQVVIWGGESGNGNFATGGALYDDGNDSWTNMGSANQPTNKTRYAWAWSGTDLVVFGGQKSNGNAQAQAYAWKEATNTWRVINSVGDVPAARYDAFAAWTTSGFFLSGGTDENDTSFDDAYLLDLTNDTWTLVSAPPGMSRAMTVGGEGWSAWTGLKVLLVQGYTPPTTSLSSLTAYQANNDTWATPASASADHKGGVGVWTGSEMFLWSGFNGASLTTVGERFKP